MSKTSDKVLLAISLTAAAAIIMSAVVLQYNSTGYTNEKMANARAKAKFALTHYENAYNDAVIRSADTLETNPEYLKLISDAKKLSGQLDSGRYKSADEYNAVLRQIDMILIRADSLAEKLRSEYINKDRKLQGAEQYNKFIQQNIAHLKRDSVITDSIRRVPVAKRFGDNLAQMRTDYHSAVIARHLKKMQRTR